MICGWRSVVFVRSKNVLVHSSKMMRARSHTDPICCSGCFVFETFSNLVRIDLCTPVTSFLFVPYRRGKNVKMVCSSRTHNHSWSTMINLETLRMFAWHSWQGPSSSCLDIHGSLSSSCFGQICLSMSNWCNFSTAALVPRYTTWSRSRLCVVLRLQ